MAPGFPGFRKSRTSPRKQTFLWSKTDRRNGWIPDYVFPLLMPRAPWRLKQRPTTQLRPLVRVRQGFTAGAFHSWQRVCRHSKRFQTFELGGYIGFDNVWISDIRQRVCRHSKIFHLENSFVTRLQAIGVPAWARSPPMKLLRWRDLERE